jgi:hypothetical protein
VAKDLDFATLFSFFSFLSLQQLSMSIPHSPNFKLFIGVQTIHQSPKVFLHNYDVAKLIIIHNLVLAKFDNKRDMKVKKLESFSHFWLHAKTQ